MKAARNVNLACTAFFAVARVLSSLHMLRRMSPHARAKRRAVETAEHGEQALPVQKCSGRTGHTARPP